ncbi:TonB-dependent receptor [Sphingomonas sp. ST-64]|uniref:TonB-dependent receptor n=1 Tax=Sphingomonas plantiphila TaxID=3163295 RepID=A0ABW8YQH8_9SPHN
MSLHRKTSLPWFALLASTALSGTAFGQEVTATDDDVVVTATRRDETVQTAPINISAVDGEAIEMLGLQNLRDFARAVPGVYILDQGNRAGTPIVFRGLNATGLSSFDGNNTGGGAVATYVGDIPLYVDLRLNDMERVEFLLGPQGTLYGAGTLGGAIRYIPRRPQLGTFEGEIRGDGWSYSHGKGVSTDTGITVNLPIGNAFAFRASADLMNDRGFIDYPFLVQQVGVSNPNANPADPAAYAANLKRARDLNTDDTFSARAALRFNPSDTFDATLSYYYQDQATDGRQFSQARLTNYPVPIGKYENALRVPEFNSRETQLVALEAELDLGFAKLVSATGYSTFHDLGQRDQTDLLIGLEYSYEQFPSFTSFTEEKSRERTWTQEVRLVSQFDGPFSFIAGAFYNKQKVDGYSKEFTPGYAEFNGGLRPDALEYYSVNRSDLREVAGYGEATFQITDRWQVTGGIRYYDYDLKTQSATDFPLLYSVFLGRDPYSIDLDFTPGGQKDNGFLFKANTSYKFTPSIMVYATFSQGYRIGNSNGLEACEVPPSGSQTVCAQPNELFYTADKTNNYEIGFKTQFLDKRVTLNGAVYYIDWEGPQVAAASQVGLSPIIINGAGARSRGVELYGSARLAEGLSIRATYSYTNAELTELSPNLLQILTPPGFSTVYVDGQKGDRLPGSPEHQGSFFIDYETPLSGDWTLGAAYGVYLQSDVLSRTGGRAGGLTLPGFDMHQAQLRLEKGGWKFTVYGENLFNEYAETGVRGTPLFDQSVADANGDPVYVRTYGTFVAPPRRIGLRVSRKF